MGSSDKKNASRDLGHVLCNALSTWSSPREEIVARRRGNIWRPRPVAPSAFPWADRVHAYHWAGDGYQELKSRLTSILSDSHQLAQALTERPCWNLEQQRLAIDLTGRVFDWGRVRKPSIEASHVHGVFSAALQAAGADIVQPIGEAPWSSGWTKVAAFATAHLDKSSNITGDPQIIWDSRVANAIRRIVSAVEMQRPMLITAQIKNDLRQIHGRGGERMEIKLSNGWNFAHTFGQKWTAQRAGSRLVGQMRDALNAAPERFGRMPGSTHPNGHWTSWGVGLALFVEGY